MDTEEKLAYASGDGGCYDNWDQSFNAHLVEYEFNWKQYPADRGVKGCCDSSPGPGSYKDDALLRGHGEDLSHGGTERRSYHLAIFRTGNNLFEVFFMHDTLYLGYSMKC